MIIVIPMAGRGSRFANEGYDIPKPLIPIAGKPMLLHALQSIIHIPRIRLIFIALQEHEKQYKLNDLLKKEIKCHFELVLLEDVTEGQLCTVMAAESYFMQNEDLLIAPSDTYIRSNLDADIQNLHPDCKGIISVANLPGERWSFAATDQDGWVIKVAEKERISDFASTGYYYFSDASYFVEEARKLIDLKEKTRREYFVIPVYQKMIDQGAKISLSHVQDVWDMGTPQAKADYEKHLRTL